MARTHLAAARGRAGVVAARAVRPVRAAAPATGTPAREADIQPGTATAAPTATGAAAGGPPRATRSIQPGTASTAATATGTAAGPRAAGIQPGTGSAAP